MASVPVPARFKLAHTWNASNRLGQHLPWHVRGRVCCNHSQHRYPPATSAMHAKPVDLDRGSHGTDSAAGAGAFRTGPFRKSAVTPEAFLNAARCSNVQQSASDWMLSGKLTRPVDEPPDPPEV